LPSAVQPQTTESATNLEGRIRKANDEIFNKGNLEVLRDIFAPGYVVHPGGQDTEAGPEFIRSLATAMRNAFPDLRVEIEVLVEDGDKVAWLRTHRGTFKADIFGVKATGRPMVWQTMIVTRYENGKIAEEWGVGNFVERSQQPQGQPE
jgi:predicted ester cyclase